MATEENTTSSETPEVRRPVIRMLGTSSRRSAGRRKVCRFCADKTVTLDYKNSAVLKNFITERGKLVPRRISGNCAKHQRKLALAVRRARMIALIPFTVTGK